MWQRAARLACTPYLPPPVVEAMSKLDVFVKESTGQSEGSVTLIFTIFMAYIFSLLIRQVLFFTDSGGKAIVDNDDDDGNIDNGEKTAADYKNTVILCGPPNAGKTRLFYQLCYHQNQVHTLTSLKANVGVSAADAVRYMDVPGHYAATSTDHQNKLTMVLQEIIKKQRKQKTQNLRIILVLDATQPVASAAACLYDIWQVIASQQSQQKQSSSSNKNSRTVVVVACHKQDAPKAKNTRRIQIQLRTELEKLAQVRKPTWLQSNLDLEWSTLPFLHVHFLATSSTIDMNDKKSNNSNNNQLSTLVSYCETGDYTCLVDDSSS
mmetsp:Transcript_3111/g.4207  ORF Transcript_3111/g.4207 Transcript_3111/m.4207 type:complete len:322 (-) Transcript_3111:110-1075(-)